MRKQASPGQRPGSRPKEHPALKGLQSLCRPFRAVRIFAIHPGRCPGLACLWAFGPSRRSFKIGARSLRALCRRSSVNQVSIGRFSDERRENQASLLPHPLLPEALPVLQLLRRDRWEEQDDGHFSMRCCARWKCWRAEVAAAHDLLRRRHAERADLRAARILARRPARAARFQRAGGVGSWRQTPRRSARTKRDC